MKFAVTGAKGYIATNLISTLVASGQEVIILSRKSPFLGCDWQYFNLMDNQEIVLDSDICCVFHLAISKFSNLANYRLIDLKAAKYLTSASTAIGAKLIFFSSQTAG